MKISSNEKLFLLPRTEFVTIYITTQTVRILKLLFLVSFYYDCILFNKLKMNKKPIKLEILYIGFPTEHGSFWTSQIKNVIIYRVLLTFNL